MFLWKIWNEFDQEMKLPYSKAVYDKHRIFFKKLHVSDCKLSVYVILINPSIQSYCGSCLQIEKSAAIKDTAHMWMLLLQK